jgi:hypothetical protein
MKRLLAATTMALTVLTVPFAARGDEGHRTHDRQYPHAFDMRLEVVRTPSLTRSGTYVLKARSATSEAVTARLEWFLPRGIESVPAATVYVPATGELVAPVSVTVRATGVYDIVAALTPLSEGSRTETTARYLKVTAAGGSDSETPLPWEGETLSPLPVQIKRAPMAAIAVGDSRFSGKLTYQDETTRASVPVRGATVQLAERVVRGGFTVEDIREVVTSATDGTYAFADVPALNADGSIRNYRVNVVMRHNAFNIVDSRGAIYKRTTAWTPAVPGSAFELNVEWDIASGRSNVGHILNTLLDARDFFKRTVGFERDFIEVEYPSLNGATYYSVNARNGFVSDELIRIATSESGYRPAILHEFGHSIMTGAYGGRFDAIPFGEPQEGGHFLHTVSDAQFAISEGWAEFCEALVDDSALNVRAYRNANLPNIETNDWWTGAVEGGGKNRSGEIVEGAVASILWDLSDGPQSRDTEPAKDDDAVSNEFARVWDIFVSKRPKTVVTFRDEWVSRGYPQKDAVLTIFAENGIGKPPLKGDINGDEAVDILDLVLVAQRFGESGPFPGVNPDVTGDGVVNILDLVTVASNFGAKSGAFAAPSLTASRASVRPEADGRSFALEGVDAVAGAFFEFAADGGATESAQVFAATDSGAAWQSGENGRFLLVATGTPIPSPRFEMTSSARPTRVRLVAGEVVTGDGERVAVEPATWVVNPKTRSVPRLTVSANYPNPFNPETWIPFRLSESANVEVSVLDASGRSVRRWSLGSLLAGDYSTRAKALHWDGRNDAGESVASGVYWVVFDADGERAARRLVLSQ